ncbi:MAG TPA: STAS domain-containing protein [Vicinamibacterales bacterium]|nr:STAS domain-containing protein [Vicinamibacterales bacterium]
MHISQEQQQDVIVVAPRGRIDSTTSAALESHLSQVAKAGVPRLVVDFSEVDYISSAGLRVMLTLAKRVRDARGALALCSLGDSVRQVFELAGFLPLFSIEGTRDAAVRMVAAR